MIDCFVNYPTKTITMVAPFATTAAWLWQISQPYPRELFGRVRARATCKGFNSTDWPRKKIITKLTDLNYTPPPKMMASRFPHASRSSHIPSMLPSVVATCFWLVVVF